jgi:PAS domain S-box-containing protein
MTEISLLIVEDEKLFTHALKSLLSKLGYTVLGNTETGEEAIQFARELRPDLILMDIHLGKGISGIEAASIIWEDYHIPVIYVSGDVEDSTIQKAKYAEPYGYLIKPFSLDALRTTIEVAYNRFLYENKLAKSEEKNRLLFETMIQGAIYYSLEGKIISANTAARKIFGLTKEVILQRTIYDKHWEIIKENGDNLLPDEHPAIIAAKSGVTVNNIELGVYNPLQKKTIWVNMSAVPQFLPGENEPNQILTTLEDITERKQNEAIIKANTQLLENQKFFFNHIIDSIPSSLLVINQSMRIVSVNNNFLERTRRDLNSTLGYRINDIFPKALLSYAQIENRITEVFRTGQPFEGDKVSYHAPGLSTHIYFYRLIPLQLLEDHATEAPQYSEKGKNVLLLMDDITEREQLGEEIRNTERHLASIVECAKELVISLDPNGCIVTWNHAAEAVTGYRSEEVKGMPLESLFASEHREMMKKMLQESVSETSQLQKEINLQTSNGQEIPIAWSYSQMRNDSNKLTGIVIVGRNLTETRQLEEQLIVSDKLAALGVMAGGIAHELRNPLGIISASAQLLLENDDDLQLREQGLEKIDTAAKRASLIIENLLKFSRPNLKKNMKKVSIPNILDDTLALLENQLSVNNVSLEYHYKESIPPVLANKELIQQVFTNLILNACNAMPSGGRLTINTTESLEEVIIQFIDTGSGIPPSILPKIFDPFFTTRSVGMGSGLGLPISHSIIAQHKGTIEVKSVEDEGSTFIIRLPTETRSMQEYKDQFMLTD